MLDAYEVHDDLAVGVCLEDGVLVLESPSEGEVVVDLSVHAQRNLAVIAHQSLSSSACKGKITNDGSAAAESMLRRPSG